MPAFLTHMLAADNTACRVVDSRISDVIYAHKEAFHSGAQGGDYFMLYKYYSAFIGHTYKLLGYALHRVRPKRFFLESAQYIKNKNSDLLKSFFYGYITHYCVDFIVHPTICKFGPNPMNSHNIVEYGLDTVYAHNNSVDAVTFDRAAFVEKTFVEGDEINEFFNDTHRRLYYGFNIDPKNYTTAYKYFAHFNRIMYMPNKAQLLKIKLHNMVTILNLPSMLYYPYDEVKDLFDYETLLNLVEKAIQKSLYYIELINGYFEDKYNLSQLDAEFYNVNFMGQSVTPREEKLDFKNAYKKIKTTPKSPIVL